MNKQLNILLNKFACDFPRQTTAYEIKELGARLIEGYKSLLIPATGDIKNGLALIGVKDSVMETNTSYEYLSEIINRLNEARDADYAFTISSLSALITIIDKSILEFKDEYGLDVEMDHICDHIEEIKEILSSNIN